MAQFTIDTADNYGGQGGGGYFRLKDDHDTAQVRFLYDSIDDVTGYAVHEVKIGDKKRYVNCLRNYTDPLDTCPLCKDGRMQLPKYFVPLFNLDTNRVETWERGKKFGNKLSSLCARYPHLFQHVFEIERIGKAGDTQTTYEIYPLDMNEDDRKLTLDSFDIQEPLGSHILDKNYDELQYFVSHHDTFPEDDDTPVRRRSSMESDDTERRRTPSRNTDDSLPF